MQLRFVLLSFSSCSLSVYIDYRRAEREGGVQILLLCTQVRCVLCKFTAAGLLLDSSSTEASSCVLLCIILYDWIHGPRPPCGVGCLGGGKRNAAPWPKRKKASGAHDVRRGCERRLSKVCAECQFLEVIDYTTCQTLDNSKVHFWQASLPANETKPHGSWLVKR